MARYLKIMSAIFYQVGGLILLATFLISMWVGMSIPEGWTLDDLEQWIEEGISFSERPKLTAKIDVFILKFTGQHDILQGVVTLAIWGGSLFMGAFIMHMIARQMNKRQRSAKTNEDNGNSRGRFIPLK